MHLLVWVASLERPQKPGPVWLVFAQDLTPTKHLEEQLLQALKMKAVGIQAGGLAHDLNNLYTTISGYGTLLQTQMKTKKGSAAALTRSYIDRIIGAADRSATLTGHLLAFSRGQALQPKTWNKTAEQRTDRELESESETQGGRETILLVDDIADLRKLVEAWLQQCGYTVLVASNGEEALRIAKTHESEIHLLLTDAVMPEMTGPQLAKRLKSIAPSAKVLFMSAYHETDVGISSEEGAFLRKPFSTSLLAEKVREVLREDPYLTERGKRPAAAIPAQRLKKKPSPRRSRETRRD
jgi:CheY-like chemotaxis protein